MDENKKGGQQRIRDVFTCIKDTQPPSEIKNWSVKMEQNKIQKIYRLQRQFIASLRLELATKGYKITTTEVYGTLTHILNIQLIDSQLGQLRISDHANGVCGYLYTWVFDNPECNLSGVNYSAIADNIHFLYTNSCEPCGSWCGHHKELSSLSSAI